MKSILFTPFFVFSFAGGLTIGCVVVCLVSLFCSNCFIVRYFFAENASLPTIEKFK